jgi:CBS domain-containing protein
VLGGGLRDDARQLRQRPGDGAAGPLLGILTERDLMTRVLARALDPKLTHARCAR